ncbi:MAG: alpha/beta hydrolase [Actinomycetota bacterium]|nr:alpha/beta hydrolase [Actinomycetota bacterium]
MSPAIPGAMKIAGGGLLAVGTIAAGTAIGIAVQRRLVSRSMLSDTEWQIPTFTPDVRRLVMSDGTELHVEIDECEAEQPVISVILCHGYALSADSLIFQRAALRGKARVISYDQRSHGRSGRAHHTTHTVEQLGRDLGTIIDEVAALGPIVLIGHSMGGMTVMALADQRPELVVDRVRGIVFIAATAGGLSEVTFGMPPVIRQLVHRAAPVVASVLARGKGIVETGRRASSDVSELVLRSYSFGSIPSREASEFVADMIDNTPIDVLAEFLPALQEHNRFAVLPSLSSVRTLVIVGQQDRMTPVIHSERIAASIHGSTLAIIPGGGHMVGIEFHEEVDALILDLLEMVKADLAVEQTHSA